MMERRFNLPPSHEIESKIIKNGREVANMVERLYEATPDFLRQHLVDSNVVLVLAGLKPNSDIFIDVADPARDEEVARSISDLNERLQQLAPHIRMVKFEEPFIGVATKVRTQTVEIDNLQALERVTQATRLPGIKPFDSRTGWDGFDRWMEENLKPLMAEDGPNRVMAEGIQLGYPDQAILDFQEAYTSDAIEDLDFTKIPNAGLYDEAQPNFDFKPEHRDNPDIQGYIDEAGKILGEFYASDWHRAHEEELRNHRVQ